jgi:hypothetical protein
MTAVWGPSTDGGGRTNAIGIDDLEAPVGSAVKPMLTLVLGVQ